MSHKQANLEQVASNKFEFITGDTKAKHTNITTIDTDNENGMYIQK